MELMDCSLFNYLCKMPGYCVPEITARKFTQQIALGLLYMHSKRLAHRDLKPENILMRKKVGSSDEYELKLCDFGFAHGTDALKTQIGTMEYMAPEIMVNPSHGMSYGAEVDLWALGCVVYFMLCGALHVDRYKGRDIMAHVLSQERIELPQSGNFSDAARSFVGKLLTRNPQDRMTFEILRTHPFLAPSMHITLLMSRSEVDASGTTAITIPVVQNIVLESSDFSKNSAGGPAPQQQQQQQLLWSTVTNIFLEKVRVIKGVPREENPRLLIFHDGNVVDFNSPIRFGASDYKTVEAFAVIDSCRPRNVPRGYTQEVPIMDLNKIKEIRRSLGAAYDATNAAREAEIYCRELLAASECYESVLGRWRAIGNATGCIEEVCKKYINLQVVPALQEAIAAISARPDVAKGVIFNIPAPGNAVSVVDKQFNDEWNKFLKSLNECAIEIDNVGKPTSSSSSNIVEGYMSVFSKADERLTKYPMAISDLYTSFFVLWNAMCKMLDSISKIFTLSENALKVKTAGDSTEVIRAFTEYNTTLSAILNDNPSWSAQAFMGQGPAQRSSAGDSLLRGQLDDAFKKLDSAQKKVLELQTENTKLKTKVAALEQLYGQAESYLQDSSKKKL